MRQKSDRITDANGKLLNSAVNTQGGLGEVKTTVDNIEASVGDAETNAAGLKVIVSKVELTGETTARAVANLMASTGRQYDELKTGLANLTASAEQQFDDLTNWTA